MQKIIAIAGLAIRSAIRSRVVLALLGLLLLVLIAFPATIQGDGTWEGYVQVLIRYTLGFSFWILALAGMWAGCSAIAQDIETKTLQLVVTKPVSRLHLWLGKWLGLTMIVGLLLALCLGVTVLMLAIRAPALSDHRVDPPGVGDLLVARRVIAPPKPDVIAEARRLLREQADRGELPEDVHPNDALRGIVRNLQLQRLAVAPGGTVSFPLTLPPAYPHASAFTLQYRFAISAIDREPVPGRWIIRDEDGLILLDLETIGIPTAVNEINLEPALFSGHNHVTLDYVNLSETGVTVVFMPADGLHLLVPAGSFAGNVVRTWLILFAQLAFLIALGVTAGSLFSFPVAAFLSLYAILLIQSAGYIEGLARADLVAPWQDTPDAPGLLDVATSLLYRALYWSIQPLVTDNPLVSLATGQWISWTWALHTLAFKVLLYSGLLALLSAAALNRRELALPSS